MCVVTECMCEVPASNETNSINLGVGTFFISVDETSVLSANHVTPSHRVVGDWYTIIVSATTSTNGCIFPPERSNCLDEDDDNTQSLDAFLASIDIIDSIACRVVFRSSSNGITTSSDSE